jgi:hypothetical protein
MLIRIYNSLQSGLEISQTLIAGSLEIVKGYAGLTAHMVSRIPERISANARPNHDVGTKARVN